MSLLLNRLFIITVAAATTFGAVPSMAAKEILGKSEGQGVAFINGANFTNKEVKYDIVNGYGVVEGDIVLGTVEQLQSTTSGVKSVAGDVSINGIIITPDSYRWQNGFVPYQFEAGLPASTIQKVNDAIAHWQSRTAFRFVARNATNQASYPDYVLFRSSTGCAANVGRQGGQQSVWLSTGCSTGNAIHEIGHAVGFWHEQSREDRNSFVKINWGNIQPGKEFNFNQQITDGADIGGYDYGSIMHYSRTAFSVNGLPTIEPTNPPSAVIGQRTALSATDIGTAGTMASWLRISGGLKQVSVGFGGEVWGVSFDNLIWRYTGKNSWTQIPGQLKHVSVGQNGVVWGVSFDDLIWRYNGNGTWSKIAGSLKQIEVGAGGEVWGVSFDDLIWRYNGNNTWTNIAGRLKYVSAGQNGVVWGVNSSDMIYRYNGNNTWTQIPGSLKQVEVGSGNQVWGVNSSDSIYRFDNDNTWTQAAGRLKHVSVGANGHVWGVNSSDFIYKLK